jgi:prepilin-type processing-associated H-X9-DG protein
MKLIEMMVVIFLVALAFGLIVPAIKSSREAGRRSQCQNNMRQLGLAILNFSSSRNCFPNAGTFFDDPTVHGGDPAKSTIYRAITDPGSDADLADACLRNWVVDIIPFLDSPAIANVWNLQDSYLSTAPNGPQGESNASRASTGLGVLRCPDDMTFVKGQGNLSYVVNGGFARWYPIPVGWSGGPKDGTPKNGDVLRWTPGDDWKENLAIGKRLGVMFLGTQSGDQPWDIKTSLVDIADGASGTLMMAENTLVGYSTGSPYAGGQTTNWACPLPNFAMFLGSDDICRSGRSPSDCLGGQLQPPKLGRDGPGWAAANRRGTFEEINYGQNLSVEGSFPFANSGHPGGGNVVFCDGAVRFLSATIDGTVYAKLITPAGSKLPNHLKQGYASPDDFAP